MKTAAVWTGILFFSTPLLVGAQEASAESKAELERSNHQPAGTRGLSIPERVGQLEKGMWWNRQKLVKRLELDDKQRRQMSDVFETYLTARLEKREERSRPDAFREALVATDLDSARKEIELRAGRAAAAATADATMIIDVLAVLRATQLHLLSKAFPRVLRAAWFTEVAGPRGRLKNRRSGQEGLRAVPPLRSGRDQGAPS